MKRMTIAIGMGLVVATALAGCSAQSATQATTTTSTTSGGLAPGVSTTRSVGQNRPVGDATALGRPPGWQLGCLSCKRSEGP